MRHLQQRGRTPHHAPRRTAPVAGPLLLLAPLLLVLLLVLLRSVALLLLLAVLLLRPGPGFAWCAVAGA